jgi:hypothetical protein
MRCRITTWLLPYSSIATMNEVFKACGSIRYRAENG